MIKILTAKDEINENKPHYLFVSDIDKNSERDSHSCFIDNTHVFCGVPGLILCEEEETWSFVEPPIKTKNDSYVVRLFGSISKTKENFFYSCEYGDLYYNYIIEVDNKKEIKNFSPEMIKSVPDIREEFLGYIINQTEYGKKCLFKSIEKLDNSDKLKIIKNIRRGC